MIENFSSGTEDRMPVIILYNKNSWSCNTIGSLWATSGPRSRVTNPAILFLNLILVVVHVDGVRGCHWTEATNGPIVYADDSWLWRATAECHWHGKTEELGERTVPSHFVHQKSHMDWPGHPRWEATTGLLSRSTAISHKISLTGKNGVRYKLSQEQT